VNLSPILLFVYNRLWHTKETVTALLKNELAAESDLIIFSDGALNSTSIKPVNQVRDYVHSITGFKSIQIIERDYNFGLAKSIIDGVTRVCQDYGRVIVLEDDIIASPYFLRYMNDGLNLYENNERVISIHGYVYPTKEELPETFFLRGADCWGWATWKRGWNLFEPDGKILLKELEKRKLAKNFDMNGAYKFTKMLKDQIKGKNDSWAIRWHASAFLASKLTLYPGKSLVTNIGLDGSGTHCSKSSALVSKLAVKPISLNSIPVEESEYAKSSIEVFFRSKRISFQQIFLQVMTKRVRLKLVNLIKDWAPQKLLTFLGKHYGKRIIFEGPFLTWKEASLRSAGYDSKQILEKVLASTLKVKSGEAVYERDSVLFDQIVYSWPVTSALMWVAARNNGKLNVLDFGGALGSSYFQNRVFLESLSEVNWSVVEQKSFVRVGNQKISDNKLSFYNDIREINSNNKPNIILLSSVLQYLPEPELVIKKLMDLKVDCLVIDRTPFTTNGKGSMIKIQHVPSSIYEASYPCWFFEFKKFVEYIENFGYKKVEQFKALDNLSNEATWMGFIFNRVKD
jgi:putative methyltransferase (TIGR04325 family)